MPVADLPIADDVQQQPEPQQPQSQLNYSTHTGNPDSLATKAYQIIIDVVNEHQKSLQGVLDEVRVH